jgi:CheY-like chemotaxis protein
MPQSISADPVRLNQILSNLVNNALKFTDQGQVLTSLYYEDGSLVMSVTDSGPGIPQKKLDVLFEAFSQADQTITRKFGGTGLGLAICKRLAEAMDGSIGLRSELGKGSTFWVRIPAVALAPPVAAPKVHASAAIAIDGLATQSALGTALSGSGYQVAIAGEGTPHSDVIFATAGRLKQFDFAGARRPAVICLSWIGDSDGEAAIESGAADDLIILPLRQADILDIVTRLKTGTLRGRSVLDRSSSGMRPWPSFRGRRVIVADDNAVNREVIFEVLRKVDITVDAAENGREALDLWKAGKTDLIFMDCSMPEMDGYTATREIRAHEALDIAGSRTPVVALTAHVAGSGDDEWQKAGMDAYITKPFTMNQIVACLEAHFAGRPFITEHDGEDPGDHESILDPNIIEELRNIGGSTKLFARVLDLFASRVPQAVEQVTLLARGNDQKALADAAHALKSMCANIGASRALDACQALELAARTGQEFDAGDMTASIIREVRRVMSEVERMRRAA